MNGSQHAVAADYVFDGTEVRQHAAVVIDGTTITAVTPHADIPAGLAIHSLPDGIWLAPGFIDLQVNGGGDVLFNEIPTPEAILTIATAHRKFGTTSLLPTFITDTPEKMRSALAAAKAAIARHPSVLGIHLEGPFLSREKPGVHDAGLIREPTREDAETLIAARNGVMLVTLAPEVVPRGFIAQLTAAGIHVALGHSMATYAQTRAALAEGLSGFTHLFNAMRPLQSREPGPVAAALETPAAWYGLIADGLHVDPAMLRLALRGLGRPVLVTDAMPPVGGHQSRFRLYGEEIVAHNGRCARNDGTLAGSVLDMAKAVGNCVRMLDVPLEKALRFASAHPAESIGLGHALGRLGPGYRADIVAFDPDDLRVCATWVAGQKG
jgi:N-acetylglucosamine-6-phosphate deacetylase